MPLTRELIEDRIHSAFGTVTTPAPDALLQAAYATNEDANGMRTAFADRHWTELLIQDLFRHREMLIALSGSGYQAYVPAYLKAALTHDERYGPDLRHYLVHTLRPLSNGERHVQTTRERLSRLDVAQREVIREVLQYLADTYRVKEAAGVLRNWKTAD